MNRSFYFLMVALFAFGACKNDGGDPCATDFDQLSLLSNVGNNIILPRYESLDTKVDEMNTATLAFTASPNTTTLNDLRTKLKEANLAWQGAYIFEFGPAETNDLRNQIGNFPAFVGRIDGAISSGTFDVNTPDYAFARGFAAMDYLLYGMNVSDLNADANQINAEIIAAYADSTSSTNAKKYLEDVSAAIQTKVRTTYEGWKADGGNYINTFATTEGLAAGSPMSLLINQYNAAYELFKNNKLGDPIGAKTSYIASPTSVEAYYSKFSLELMKEAVIYSRGLFIGASHNGSVTDGIGLDDYLDAVNAKKDDTNLATTIDEQYTLIFNELNNLAVTSVVDGIADTGEFEKLKAAYAAAQNMVVFIKTDMPAVLCVDINYVDNTDDGD